MLLRRVKELLPLCTEHIHGVSKASSGNIDLQETTFAIQCLSNMAECVLPLIGLSVGLSLPLRIGFTLESPINAYNFHPVQPA